MSEQAIGYGFGDDSSQSSSLAFGGNFGTARLVKFEYNANGGKGGAAQPCLDIIISVGDRQISYRKFPVTRVFHENVQIDNTHPKFREELTKALDTFNGSITHILKCFVDEAVIKSTLAVRTANFEQFVNLCKSMLPQNFQTKPLDLFAEWQWNITGSNTKTFTKIPDKVAQGKFLIPAVAPKGGKWNKVIADDGSLSYVDAEGNKHPFERSAWFMASNYGNQQKEQEETATQIAAPQPDDLPFTTEGTAPAASTQSPATGGW